jgi:8-hydroxy-5-deazaflavin:NADPH oxidoreductase
VLARGGVPVVGEEGSMRIAVIGTGHIGGTLARRWAAAGHALVLGVREPNSERTAALLAELGSAATATDPLAAVAASDVILFAVPARAAAETLAVVGPAIGTRVVIDATNAVGAETVNALAAIRAVAPGARLARAFNSLGWENFANPLYGKERATLFYCAEDGPAHATTEQLIGDIGLDPVWVGGIDKVDLIDNLLRLWITLAMGSGTGRGKGDAMGREIAFRLLRR